MRSAKEMVQGSEIAGLRAEAEAMSGSDAMPRRDGDVVMTEPWQGRAVALAVETVHNLGLPWNEFRGELIAAIARDPQRPYYDSWLVALEQLVLSPASGVVPDALMAHRMGAASYRTDEVGHDDLEVFPIAIDGPTLLGLLSEVCQHWPSIRFGLSVDGAPKELRQPPNLSMLDGSLTIAFDSSQLRLCVGEQPELAGSEADPVLAGRERPVHAELQRQWIEGAPRRWMFRTFDGHGDQQLTVVLPSPFLDDEHRPIDEPAWARLHLWDRLRQQFVGLPADPVDRSG